MEQKGKIAEIAPQTIAVVFHSNTIKIFNVLCDFKVPKIYKISHIIQSIKIS